MVANTWDQLATNWDDRREVHTFAVRSYAQLLQRGEGLVDWPKARVLELGCGTGILSARVAALCGELVVVDSSAQMLERAQEKFQAAETQSVTVIEGSFDYNLVAATPALYAPFDLVIAASACAFMHDYAHVIGTVARMLRPGGILMQWDWLAEQQQNHGFSPERIHHTYHYAGLHTWYAESSFYVGVGSQRYPTVFGMAQRRGDAEAST